MKLSSLLWLITAGCHCLQLNATAAEPVRLTVQTDQPGAKINPAMWGLFFEDINLGADGGLYADLVKNRSFEFPDPMMGWKKFTRGNAGGEVSIRADNPFNPANPNYLRIVSHAGGACGVANEGFRGMGVRAGEVYDFSVQIRSVQGPVSLGIELVDADGSLLASERLANFSARWRQRTATLTPDRTAAKAQLKVFALGEGKLDLDMISLFPRHTWKSRPGGLRADMVQLLADLKPGFLRFPGGCIVEGNVLTNRYQWKTTIGPVEERKLIVNRWNFEFRHRPTPDYYQSFGLGFYEYFLLAEDIGAEPLPILNCGMACQFNSGQLVPLDQLDPYIQDALDLIEFANGPTNSVWGAKRAAMGHPQSFELKMLGVGNEQWGPQYLERYAAFAKVLKAKHPEIQLVSGSGPSPADERFDFLWPRLAGLKADIVDQHCYANPVWFFSSANRFDTYDRSGPRVFFGEYAAQSDKIVSVDNKNNWECALSEAAFMTGMERNADVVRLASYAPLFGHADGWQWTPNLIWVDNLRSYGTPNYHVQALFAQNRGDTVLPIKLDAGAASPVASGGIGLGTYRTAAEFKDVKVTSAGKTIFASDFSRDAKGWKLPRDVRWAVKDGALQQTDARATSTATMGDGTWKDYDLSLKARKLGGSEGFIISFRHDHPNTRVQWNLGGWGNTRHGIQSWLGVQEQLVSQTPASIDSGRWYDVKLELRGPKLNCYLDGKLVQSAEIPVPKSGGVFASAVREETSREVIVKLVNATADTREANINLVGAKAVRPGGRAITLAAARLSDVNDFDTPNRIAPTAKPLEIKSPTFTYAAPPNSLTVLRVPVE